MIALRSCCGFGVPFGALGSWLRRRSSQRSSLLACVHQRAIPSIPTTTLSIRPPTRQSPSLLPALPALQIEHRLKVVAVDCPSRLLGLAKSYPQLAKFLPVRRAQLFNQRCHVVELDAQRTRLAG